MPKAWQGVEAAERRGTEEGTRLRIQTELCLEPSTPNFPRTYFVHL